LGHSSSSYSFVTGPALGPEIDSYGPWARGPELFYYKFIGINGNFTFVLICNGDFRQIFRACLVLNLDPIFLTQKHVLSHNLISLFDI